MIPQTIQIGVSVLLAGGLVYFTIPLLRKIAYLKDLYDIPDGERKLHNRYVPSFGGIAIYLAFVLSFSLSGLAGEMPGYPYFTSAMLLLFFTGMKDDLIGLAPAKKLNIEVIVGVLIIYGSQIYIRDFSGILGINTLSLWVSLPVTLFTMIVIVNAYNLIDGADGLAGSIGILACLSFGAGFILTGEVMMATMALIMASALAGFLKYNRQPAAIFMGDTGSLIVGFILSVLAVDFINLNRYDIYNEYLGNSSSVMPVAILIVPLYDTMRVVIKRLRRNRSPFDPGKDHVHHELMRMGLGHTGTSVILSIGMMVVIGVAVSLSGQDPHIILAGILISALVVFPTNGFKRRLLRKTGFTAGIVHHDPEQRKKAAAGNEEQVSSPLKKKRKSKSRKSA